ncbi:MAG: hypothetical protein H0Z32_11295 [Bacillaceae bacterium]|nr:hypothetical protein [Bacillaceae bacterium]
MNTSYQPYGLVQVLHHLQNSMYALQVQCSFTSQMKLYPDTKNLDGLEKLHKYNYKSSYHRSTAIGCLYRILNGEKHRYVYGIMINCMFQAKKYDKKSIEAFEKMKEDAANSEKATRWIQTVNQWLNAQSNELKLAMKAARQTLGKEMWEYGEDFWEEQET